MPLNSGARLGVYEVLSALGAGGMGEVYRARDTKLGRDVALKILPPALAADPDRVARFQREAQLLASLNHPQIGAIYGFEESNDVRALVLELVEGPTLADRIAQGPLPFDEALAIARQIADALEAAHEQGVVHRDLKPANIKLRPDGVVKVLDFGLAKMLETAPAASTLSMSPTLSVHATFAGMILGTAAYMSPEQARGRPADKRADVWAFGCVLFEMLTGKRPFDGEDVTEALGAVIHKEPAWDTLPASTPATVRTVLQRCMQKDPKQRARDIGDVRLALEGAFESRAEAAAVPAATADAQTPAPPRWRRVATVVATLFAGVGITAIGGWAAVKWSDKPPQLSRFAIVPPPAQPLNTNAPDRAIAISPDGTHIIYRGGVGTAGAGQMLVRAIDQLDARVIAGIPGFREPFVSPDGRWIGFHPNGELRKVSITGGPSILLSRIQGAPRGASWGPDDTIIFATGDNTTGLMSVPAAGGEPKVLTKPDTAHGEADHVFPAVLPSGSAVLFTITSPGQADTSQVAVLDLKTGQRKILIRGGSQAQYVDTGYLVYAAAGSLRAVRFDAKRLEVLSDPVPVVEQVLTVASGEASFTVSRTGTLVYVPGAAGSALGPQRSLVWVNRQGKEEPIKAPARTYTYPRLSPDGSRLAIDVRDQENDIWIWDLARETLTRLTFDATVDQFPVWTPDSRQIIFSSQRAGIANLYRQAADGTGAVERLTTSSNQQEPSSISPDGTRVVLRETAPSGTGQDIHLLTLGGPSTGPAASQRRAEPLIQTTFAERNAEISPDGRWVAYESIESGQYQIYVRPFPKVDGGRWQVSTGGGTRPLWARNGRELFYLEQNGALITVPVQTAGSTFSAGNPSRVFEGRYFGPGTGNSGRTYDVSPDGQRFLMIKESPTAEQNSNATPASMIVVLNWTEELKRLVPAR